MTFFKNTVTKAKDLFIKIKSAFGITVISIAAALFALTLLTLTLFFCRTCSSEKAKNVPPVSENNTPVSESDTVSFTDMKWSGWTETTVIAACPIYSQPNFNSAQQGNLSANDEIILIRRDDTFSQIRYGLGTGWIPTASLSPDIVLDQQCDTVYTDGSVYDLTGTKYGDSLKALCEKHGGKGIQIAIIEKGRVAYTFQYGYANTGAQLPVTADTKYRVASLSKLALGISAMSMHDLGLLDIDTDVSEYFGTQTYNPNHKSVPITLRYFLTHTSTISNKFNYKKMMGVLRSSDSYTSRTPGAQNSHYYSNVGYRVAGTIMELASDMTVVDFMRTYFAPLSMNASYSVKELKGDDFGLLYGGVKPKEDPRKRTIVYSSTPGNLNNYQHFAGSYVTSAKDLAKLLSILVNDGSYNGVCYISPETVSDMETVYCSTPTYDQCITLRRQTDLYGGREVYYHTGNSNGMLALASYVDDEKSGVVVLTSGAPLKRDEHDIYKCCSKLTEYCYTEIIGSGLYEEVYS